MKPTGNPMRPSGKTFQKDGKWMVKPSRTEVLKCACGVKYIKTRADQTTCIKCMYLPR